ncbi:MAG: pilus assembly protein TadG-related protein [Pirellulaceae bacterium]|nr:pilus assembly protein TadG-related protein [Pirellulaceae bacterium]
MNSASFFRYRVLRPMVAQRSLIARVHRDQEGSISIVSVFGLMLLVFLLGLVMNAGRQVDQKVKMQNAADSATYAGGVVVGRGMNTLAFTNHLMSDVFAITAFFREGNERNAESMTPAILDNWARIAPTLIGSEFPRFDQLGLAIEEKVPREREMVFTFSQWAYAASEIMSPVFETILAERMIPEFQRALVESTPRLAQYATDEVARRHGQAWPRPVELRGVLWRTVADPVGGISEYERRTLPVVDPVMDDVPNQEEYMEDARQQRSELAHEYLRRWNNESMQAFDDYGKMSQFANLWRIFTCGQLQRLLVNEYPETNLPFQIRHKLNDVYDVNRHLEQYFLFVGVVYREKIDDRIPGIYQNPIENDSTAYAQLMMFVPHARLVKHWLDPAAGTADGRPGDTGGGIPGEQIPIPIPGIGGQSVLERSVLEQSVLEQQRIAWQIDPGSDGPGSDDPNGEPTEDSDESPGDEDELPWIVRRQSGRWFPSRWDLVTQNWTVQLTPATSSSIPEILSLQPYVNHMPAFELPDLTPLTSEDLQWLSHH